MILNSPIISGSLTVTGNIIASGSITLSGSVDSASFAATASFVALAQSASNAVSAETASFANAFTVAGNLTAQTLVVQTITSSVDFVTGSTRFGSILGNTHVFSGSVTMNPGGLFVSSSSNVGIGTSTPAAKLDVKNDDGVANGLHIIADFNKSTSTSAQILLGYHANGTSVTDASIYSANSLPLRFYTGATMRMTIEANGNIGIGTSNPSYTLDVSGTLRTTNAISIQNNQNATSTSTFSNNDTTNTSSRQYIDIVSGNRTLSLRCINGDNTYIASNGASIQLQPNNATAMTLLSTGQVGIGTSAVDSTISVDIQNASPTSNNVFLRIKNNAGSEDVGLKIAGTFGTAFEHTIGVNTIIASADLCFTNSNTAGYRWYVDSNERMRITSGGMIGFNGASIYTGAGCVNTSLSTGSDFCFSGVNTAASNPRGVYIRFPNDSGSDFAYYLESVGLQRFYVTGAGVIWARSQTVNLITSDYNLKTDIKDYDKGLAEVLKMKPRYFKFKDNLEVIESGFIAQEMEEAIAGSMIDVSDALDSAETHKSYQIDWYPLLVKAIQELKAQNDALQSRIETLESK
jgi:hypothetical protein